MDPENGAHESPLSADDCGDTRAPVSNPSPYHEFSQRVVTFNRWPLADVVPAVDLALGGLWYTGNKDEVKCAFCQTVFHEWNRGDLPFDEHRRLAPHCPFVRANLHYADPATANSQHTVRSLRPKTFNTLAQH